MGFAILISAYPRSANGGKFDALARAQALHRQGSRPGGAVASTSPLAGGLTSIIKQNSSAQLLAKGGKGHTYMVRGKPRLIRQVAIQVGPSDQPRPASTPALCQDPDQAGGLVTKQVSFKETVEAAGCPVHHPAEAGSQGPGLGERFRSLYAKLTEASHEDEDAPQETPGQEEAEQEAAAVATAAPVVTLVTESGVTVRSPQLEAGERRDRRVSLGTLAQAQPDTLHTKHGSSLTNLKVGAAITISIIYPLGVCRVWARRRCTGRGAARVRTRCWRSSPSSGTASSPPSPAAATPASRASCTAGPQLLDHYLDNACLLNVSMYLLQK